MRAALRPLTLRSLWSFALGCPNLQELTIYIHDTAEPIPEATSTSKLRKLNLTTSFIKDPSTTTSSILAAFPTLRQFDAQLTLPGFRESNAHKREKQRALNRLFKEINRKLPSKEI
jgi:hypothetical protein